MSAEDSARYRRAKAIAFEVLEEPPGQRAERIEAGCGGDEALRREVVWLIEAAERPDADAVPPLLSGVAGLGIQAPVPRDYRLIEKLGEGGMGVVYLAERSDGDLRQRVALKLLHFAAIDDDAVTRRFASERRILAELTHPNIARLIDAGLTAEGRPFLAMEYVDGARLDAWCDERALPLRARIELFLKVCAAVDHAHRHLVIHRDIKPANILVDRDGEPKLLDFGIARLVDAEEAAHRTETGLRALTLAYASPEQIEGRPLNTATDVYSLGIVLYQLVSGAHPFDHLGSAHLVSNAIVSGDITPPSRLTRRTRTAQPAHARGDAAAPSRAAAMRVPRDVDAIVLKALRREPAQRYASPAELAADLRRFLASEPVVARRGAWHYRASRFAWRWRFALSVALAFAVVLAGFVIEREAQLKRTATERDRAEALVAFMNDLFENADSLRSRGNQVTVREMLDRGAHALATRSDIAPTQRRAMLLAMAHAYNALGQGSEALPLLKSAQALGESDTLDQRTALLSELAAAYSTNRDTAASIAADEAAIALLRTAPGDHADAIARMEIRSLQNHVNLLDIPLAESRARLRAILARLEARPKRDDALSMQAYRALAAAYSDERDGRESLAMAQKAVEISQRLYGPDDPRVLPNRFAEAVAAQSGDREQAIRLYESLAADYERLVGPGTTLATVLNNLGILLSEAGRTDESIAAYRRAADIALKVGGATSPIYLLSLSNLATQQSRSGDAASARALMLGVVPMLAERASTGTGSDRVSYAAALEALALADAQLGRVDDAERAFREAERTLEGVDANAYPDLREEIRAGLAGLRPGAGASN
ncbi:MAG TPA: serine/threonine-protein kinase [Rhodanobacteraceae bacterium]|nr:serine/threonine-protein kinase [Rhodanobacteraceae bacterium]